jgi:hypothetical protein
VDQREGAAEGHETLAIEEHREAEGTFYSLHFVPGAVVPLARALAKAGRPVNGYVVESVMIHLSEKGDPKWGAELEFDSENDLFCVRCARKGPLVLLLRRLEKRLADPLALRRLVKAAPPGLET